jgi:hypothetical protein
VMEIPVRMPKIRMRSAAKESPKGIQTSDLIH